MNERRLIQCLACMQDEVCTTAPLRLCHSRFVSRIAAERLVERLDLDQFRPVMTSERRPGRGKREWQQPEPDQGLPVCKRERREGEYGNLASLDTDLLNLDILEPRP